MSCEASLNHLLFQLMEEVEAASESEVSQDSLCVGGRLPWRVNESCSSL